MSTHEPATLTPDQLRQAEEERADDRLTNAGAGIGPLALGATEGVSESATPHSATPARRGRRRPLLKDFTGVAEDHRDRLEDTELGEATIARGHAAIAAIRKARGSDGSGAPKRIRNVFELWPNTPDELIATGLPTTTYRDPFGYEVTTLRDPRDPQQRYDPHA